MLPTAHFVAVRPPLGRNVDFDEDGEARASISAQTLPCLRAAEEQLGCPDLSPNLTTKESGRSSLGALPLNRVDSQGARDAAIKEVRSMTPPTHTAFRVALGAA
jgi:hypothetical protein